MSQEQALKTLMSLGFEEIDAKIYVYLAKKGLRKASEICKALKLKKQQFYPSIKQLQSKGIVSSTIEHPARFSAMSFEEVLDFLIKAKIEETQQLQQSKDEILSNWQNLELEDDKSSKFTVVSGRSFIYLKIQQMIQATTKQISAITTVSALTQADQRGIFDASYDHPLKSQIQFRFLSELSKENLQAMKSLLKETANAKLNVEGRSPDVSLTQFPQMIVKDEDEALFFIKPRTENSIIEKDDVCLWTDCKTLVKAFIAVFEEIWRNSTDIPQKISEIETSKQKSKSFIIQDAATAQKKYRETLKKAKNEIIMLTSAEGLMELCKPESGVGQYTKRVSIKIMAPIVRKNYALTEQLLNFCEVRHVPTNYAEIVIVDGRYLFKFKPFPDHLKLDSWPSFEETFYAEDPEYVGKMEKTLRSIWNAALTPSTIRLDSMLGPFGSISRSDEMATIEKTSGVQIIDVKPLGTVTEKEVLDAILNAKRLPAKDPSKEPMREYASLATAVIHPPKQFSLPEMMIMVHNIEKQSTFGAADAVVIHLWLETPTGPAYVPVAVATDSPRAQAVWKIFYAQAPAGNNIRLVKKDELQVRVHGNTLFAGWTVPIPLYPPPNMLPPACLLVEGYGDIKTSVFTLLFEPGFRAKMECNFFNAFVTFMHPSSKYSGPGTDGIFTRDFVMTCYPPQNSSQNKLSRK